MSNKDRLQQVEENLFSKFSYLPGSLGYEIKQGNGVQVIDCKLNTSMFNIVCNTNLLEQDLDKNIQHVIDRYKGRAFAWWIGVSCQPRGLESAISRAGLKKESDERAMFCSLSNFQEFELNKKISIKQVESRQELSDFIKIISSYDEYAYEVLDNELIISDQVKNKNPLFVAYYEGEVVATGALHFNKGIAGIYDIITLEKFRGKGIGTNVMKFLVNYSHRRNVEDLCLFASSDSGFRIYESLGFNVVGNFSCYEWYGE